MLPYKHLNIVEGRGTTAAKMRSLLVLLLVFSLAIALPLYEFEEDDEVKGLDNFGKPS